VWHRLDAILKEVENEYWKQVGVVIADGEREWEYAVERLLSVRRGYSVLSIFPLFNGVPEEDKVRVSFKALKQISEEGCVEQPDSMTGYHIEEAIKLIQDSKALPLGQKVMIEWRYFEVFSFVGKDDLRPKSINVAIADDPGLFCELLCLAYLAEGDEEKARPKMDEQQARRVKMAWKTLHYWNGFPGLKEDGHVDVKKFSSWIRSVKALAKKERRLVVALMVIGNAVARLPMLSKGFWMDETVARFLDKKSNAKACESFRIGMFNARGVHFRDKSGEEDRALAQKYRAMADEADTRGYLNIGQAMRDLAEDVESTGRMFSEM